MSLGKKTLALFLVLGLAICAGSYVALRVSVLPTFQAFEQRETLEALARVESLLDSQLDALNVLNLEYSAWDETVRYIQDGSAEYEEAELSPGYWFGIDISMLLALDATGDLRYGWIADPDDGQFLDLAAELLEPVRGEHPFAKPAAPAMPTTGLLRTRSGVMHVSAYPIVATDGTGPVNGRFVIGKYLNEAVQADVGQRSTTDLSIHVMGEQGLPLHIVAAFRDAPDPDADTATLTNDRFVHGMKVLPDVFGLPAAVLEVRQLRTISGIGADTIRTTMVFLAFGSIGFLLAALFFTQRLIVAPIGELTRKILKIQRTGNLEMDVGKPRADEVGMLAGQFAELTTGLAKARQELENARDEALSMSKAKTEFLARMSHEIRTPMNGVLGMTELLQSTNLDEKQQRFAKTIYASAESLLHIINDILDISKIEAGKLELDIAPFNLRHMVEECLELLADGAHRKGLELIGSISPDTFVHVEGDALRLRQVLINLLSNSVKFTEKGEVILRVEELEHGEDTITYRFDVEDTGVGIDAENLEKVFEPFTQEDGSTTRRYGGTGLGLSICKQLLELMGGEIGAESTHGRGACFWFTVTLGKDEAEPETLHPGLLAAKRVLVVDDNATNREALGNQLEEWNMQVEAAASGPEALGMLTSAARKDSPFDIVLLDMSMPEMDGVELAASIRGNSAIEALPMVMLSSVSSGDAGDDRDMSNIDAWLTKPVRQARLYDALVSHLSRAGATIQHPDRTVSAPLATNDNAGSNLRVLLAEDNEVNQRVALGMLNELGHDVTVVSCGREAVAVFETQDFDVVLMDCRMPGLDGFAATREIRRLEKDRGDLRVPIVAVTANALTGDRERCLAAGMDDYLSKPFSLQTLGAALAANANSNAATSKGSVLIVEDNPVNQQVTQAMVRELGYTAQIVGDGEQALQAMQSADFDIVLMDCHMPVLNGYDATRKIRRREEEASADGQRVPIIAVTADLMQSNRQRCLACGMDDYVTKPFTEEQLRLVIARWLGQEDVADQPPVGIDQDGFSSLTETTTLASIDRLALEEIFQLDSSPGKNIVREIVVSYCALSTKLILQLRAAVAEHDTEQVELLAHSLKGSSGQVGAVLLAALCEQIVSGARNDDLSNAPSLCERAAVEHSAVIIALDKELQRIAA